MMSTVVPKKSLLICFVPRKGGKKIRASVAYWKGEMRQIDVINVNILLQIYMTSQMLQNAIYISEKIEEWR
jgi:hypothetical protein